MGEAFQIVGSGALVILILDRVNVIIKNAKNGKLPADNTVEMRQVASKLTDIAQNQTLILTEMKGKMENIQSGIDDLKAK